MADDSLRDQLCQIEQSLGVCHVAEVQAWPGKEVKEVKDTSVKAIPMPGSALTGSLIRNSRNRNLNSPEHPEGQFGPHTQLQQVESHLGTAPPAPVDGLMTKLDAAVDQLIKGSVRRFTGDGTVIELGPSSTPGLPPPPPLSIAPRLPQQLAEIRQQLRQLSVDCDRLQALGKDEKDENEAIENVEAEHANAMSQATQLLDALNSECDPTE